MALSYRKISAEQDEARFIVEPGEYAFFVDSLTRKVTKKGNNEMLEVKLSVLNEFGGKVNIQDWIVLDLEGMEWKFRHFAATCGLLDKYDNDTLTAVDFKGKNGVVKLTIAEYEKDGLKIKTNRVADYVKPGFEKPPVNKTEATNHFYNDDIKF